MVSENLQNRHLETPNVVIPTGAASFFLRSVFLSGGLPRRMRGRVVEGSAFIVIPRRARDLLFAKCLCIRLPGWIFPSSFFACNPLFAGVQAWRELIELRRGHDSTGLRAEHALNTPHSRCASLAKRTSCLRRFADDTATRKKGKPPGFPFFHFLSQNNFRKFLRKRFFKKTFRASNFQSALSGQYFRKISVSPTCGDAAGALFFGCCGDAGDGGRATKPRWTLAPATKRLCRRSAPAPLRTAAPADLRVRKYL